ncbi:MAG TPA: PSD1 and planctomycete cytochrome C domain-containing protein [Verrucomicrobiae bacterium]|nr:PSD1 and planctomycete cytochrome C domain-containing protein [Verrucomicrobiae bacterium]
MNRALYLTAMLLAFATHAFAGESSAPINFSREIRPILSENCFTCHGPDPGQRKAKLRLDTKEGAFEVKDGKPVIKAGDSSESELIRRITTTDEDDLMPPGKSGKKLTTAQIDLLKRWIDQGAKWETHWAYQKPVRPPLPDVKSKSWPRNEIDYFVLGKLEKEGLSPNPEADKPTLARRVSLDLNGLPPTIDELDAYLADRSEEAYSKVVDRLMDSSRYGEQMARYWLDSARYADSHGYHIDSLRNIWKYREWVIDALNKNMPFDEFTKEQLAGDLLPTATTSQKIASGFVRCNMSTGEGGAIEEEYRAKYGFDRLETMSTVFLGLTMTCARCHTHKYDPITQKEYYQLFSFFNSLEEPVMDGNRPNPDPFLKLPTARQSERLSWLKDSIGEADKKLEAPIPELDAQQPGWQAKWNETLGHGWEALSLGLASSNHSASFTVREDKSVVPETSGSDEIVWHISTRVPAGQFGGLRLETFPAENGESESGVFRVAELEGELIPESGKSQKLQFQFAASDATSEKNSIRNAIDGKADTVWALEGSRSNAHTSVFLLKEPQTLAEPRDVTIRLHLKGAASEKALARFRLSAATDHSLVAGLFGTLVKPWRVIGPFKGDDVQAALYEEYPPESTVDYAKKYAGVRDEISWKEQPGYEDGKSHVFVDQLHGVHGVYYFHRSIHAAAPAKLEVSLRADDLVRVWFNGTLLTERDHKTEVGGDPIRLTLNLRGGENQLLVKVVNHQNECRFRFDQKPLDDPSLPAQIAAVLAATATPSGDEAKRVRNHYRTLRSPEWKQTSENLALWREEQGAIEQSIPTTLIAKESSQPHETHMLMRGEYDKLGEVVTPGVPAILPPLPKDAQHNRLGLAEWLVNPDHPLTARVMVNRIWQHYFGTGLVKTAEDFGMQGESPSHPELLDWLATEFIESGWNIKHIHRLIVTSATYRQSSAAPASLYTRDPENRLLARGPRFRVDGETLRDTALAVSGLLVEKIGGPSVKPYQPAGLWEAVSYNNSQKYEQDPGDANYRRTLYTHWKRQSPPPNLLLFDAPTREYCVVRRPRTNTPLQALDLLNDPQFVEASRAFAARIVQCGARDNRRRIEYAFRLATARNPSSDEIQTLEDVLQIQRHAFEKDATAAEKLLINGSASPELAAWTTVASMILNLDETVTKN